MTPTPRCQPPEEFLGVDGWHWVQVPDRQPSLMRWAPQGRVLRPVWVWGNALVRPEDAAQSGWCYLMPVPSPAQLTALVRAGRAVAALPGLSDAFDTPSIRALAAALSHFRSIPDGAKEPSHG